jgi:hypothetical protein
MALSPGVTLVDAFHPPLAPGVRSTSTRVFAPLVRIVGVTASVARVVTHLSNGSSSTVVGPARSRARRLDIATSRRR